MADNQNGGRWLIHAVRVAPEEHRMPLALVILALLLLVLGAAFIGGNMGHHHQGEE